MKPVKDFKELRVYQRAFKAASRIFESSNHWPKEERYSLTDQIRRSSRSVCANIGEAWFKRCYPKHFVSKLSDAGAEATETMVWVDFAVECGYLPSEEAHMLSKTYNAVIGGLVKMMRHPDQWCLSTTREDPADYSLGH